MSAYLNAKRSIAQFSPRFRWSQYRHRCLVWVSMLVTLSLAMPAKADSVVFEELVRMAQISGKSYPPTDPTEAKAIDMLKVYLDKLDEIPADNYRDYPISKADGAIVLDKMAFMLKDGLEREKICFDVERSIRTQGPRAFKMLTIGMLFQGLSQGNQNNEELPPITAEAILVYHTTVLRFQCANEILEE